MTWKLWKENATLNFMEKENYEQVMERYINSSVISTAYD